jgi:hypothetical protein
MSGAASMSTRSAGGLAKRKAMQEEESLPVKFHCREGAQCLTVQARWLAWVEREAARENGLLPADPTDVRPPLPLHGHHSHAAEALTANASCFLPCGHFVCITPHPEARHRLSCLDTHRHRCKQDGKYDLEVLRRIAVERGVLDSKLRKTAESSDKVRCPAFAVAHCAMDYYLYVRFVCIGCRRALHSWCCDCFRCGRPGFRGPA